ncbi:MAG TPA: DUF3857 domain-containing protein [Acidobacteriaceae bacterium]|jgi:hypothetical protein|nr:DUF3857 domain-containing protein [Acidobacteriaceae bacterium]
MTSQPQVPGAAAVYLDREETILDDDHTYSIYVRLKVLTEKGKDYANVSMQYGNDSSGIGFTVDDIAGRTIHSDGTVIPFTGKPYQRLIEKTHDAKVMEKVFTLPDVEVGSILEYRYTLRLDDEWFWTPTWYVQQDLYMRKGHFLWKATDKPLEDAATQQEWKGIAWTSVLPEGVAVKRSAPPKGFFASGEILLNYW